MKPLQSIQRVLTWLSGLHPHESDSNLYIMYKVITTIVLRRKLIAIILSNIYDKSEQIFTLSIENGFFLNLFSNYFSFYSDDDSDSFHLLQQTNDTCEWMWPIYKKYASSALSSTLRSRSSIAL